jgi:amyloid beta precursor protein binding protein 1
VAYAGSYVALQQIYLDKAAEDLVSLSGTVSDSLQALGKPSESISEGELKRFCQNAGKL